MTKFLAVAVAWVAAPVEYRRRGPEPRAGRWGFPGHGSSVAGMAVVGGVSLRGFWTLKPMFRLCCHRIPPGVSLGFELPHSAGLPRCAP